MGLSVVTAGKINMVHLLFQHCDDSKLVENPCKIEADMVPLNIQYSEKLLTAVEYKFFMSLLHLYVV